MEQLRKDIIKWADDKGILSKATPATQATKILEECLELVIADLHNNRPEIEDVVGDVFITILIEAQLLGLDLDEVFPHSFDLYAFKELLNIEHYSPRSILAVASNIFGAVTEHHDEYNTADRLLQTVYYKLFRYCWENNITFYEAAQSAYGVISKRTGQMVNGVFVKD